MGTETPKHSFMHVNDMAAACVYLMENYNEPNIVNIGTGEDITIKELAETIRNIVGYTGEIMWDSTKPDGTSRKLLDVSRLHALGFHRSTLLRQELTRTYTDFISLLKKKNKYLSNLFYSIIVVLRTKINSMFSITLHQLTKRIFPRWVYDRVIRDWDRNGFKKYFNNTSWLFGGRIVFFITSFITVVYVGRYLGPEGLGKLSYVQSLIAIFAMFASLGIDQIVLRDLIARPEDEGEILGTAIVTKIFFGILTFFATVVTAILLNNEPELTWLIAIVALSFIFQPFSILGSVFNARVLSKYNTYIGLIIAFLIPILKFIVMWIDKGVLYFGAIIAFEALINSVLYWWLYKKIFHGSLRKFSVSWRTFKRLTSDSWPLMFVGVTWYLYARIDQVMIQHFIGSTSVGYYEVAVRLTEPLGFFPGIIISSLFPALINAKKNTPKEYQKRFRSLVLLCMSMSITLATIIFALAPYLVGIIYGPEYTPAITILRIYVWSNVGTIATSLMYNYFIAENRAYMQLTYTTLGAILNIILNLIMIPRLGITGAAYATLITVTFVVGTFLCTRSLGQKNSIAPLVPNST